MSIVSPEGRYLIDRFVGGEQYLRPSHDPDRFPIYIGNGFHHPSYNRDPLRRLLLVDYTRNNQLSLEDSSFEFLRDEPDIDFKELINRINIRFLEKLPFEQTSRRTDIFLLIHGAPGLRFAERTYFGFDSYLGRTDLIPNDVDLTYMCTVDRQTAESIFEDETEAFIVADTEMLRAEKKKSTRYLPETRLASEWKKSRWVERYKIVSYKRYYYEKDALDLHYIDINDSADPYEEFIRANMVFASNIFGHPIGICYAKGANHYTLHDREYVFRESNNGVITKEADFVLDQCIWQPFPEDPQAAEHYVYLTRPDYFKNHPRSLVMIPRYFLFTILAGLSEGKAAHPFHADIPIMREVIQNFGNQLSIGQKEDLDDRLHTTLGRINRIHIPGGQSANYAIKQNARQQLATFVNGLGWSEMVYGKHVQVEPFVRVPHVPGSDRRRLVYSYV